MADSEKLTEVLIGGKVYRLSGASPEYLQRVAAYLNAKIAECRSSREFRVFDADYRALLLNLNLADDYFKASDENAVLKRKNEELEKELYAMRHDAVSTKLKLENSLKQQEKLEQETAELKKSNGGNGRRYGF